MKVEYKCTLERINDIIDRAKRDDREIDHIELSHGEWYAFLRKWDVMTYFERADRDSITYRGADIRKGTQR